MPTFDFSAPDGKTYSVTGPDGATPDQAFQILQKQLGQSASVTPNNVVRSAASGVPIAGGLLNKLEAATNATLAPALNRFFDPKDQLAEPNWADRYQHSLADQNNMDQAFEQQHPIVDTAAKIAGGTAAFAPLASTTVGARALGLVGDNLPSQIAAGTASGAGIGAADALTRGEDPVTGAASGALFGGAGPVVGRGIGKVVEGIRGRASPVEAVPSGSAIKDAATEGYDAVRDLGVTVKPEAVQNLATQIQKDFRENGFRDYLAPKTFGVLDELKNGKAFTTANEPELAPQQAKDAADIRAKYGDQVADAYERQNQQPAATPAAPATPSAPSLLQFIASKGGLGPDAELDAIGAGSHTVNVDGLGRRKLVRQGGWPLDYAREAAEEAGYLRGDHNGTSTVNDLLDAIDAEMRGQKRYPEGFEGTVGKREQAAMSEREQHEFDAHMRGLEDDLTAAGHGQLGPEVKQRAINLMSNEGMDADTAVEHALGQLEQEDAAVPHAADFPGDRATPQSAAPASRVVYFGDLHGLRRALGKAAQSIDPVEKAAASKAISRLDKYLENIPESDVIGGDAKKAASLLKTANQNYSVAKLAEKLQGKVDAAHLQASSANSGANLENALRQRVKDILKSPKLSQGFTQNEKLMMQRIVRGSAPANIIRAVGNLLGGGGGLGAIVTGGAGMMATGSPAAFMAPLAGAAVKKIGNRMTEAQLAKLDEMIRSRAPASKAANMVRQSLAARRARAIANAGRVGMLAGSAIAPAFSGQNAQ